MSHPVFFRRITLLAAAVAAVLASAPLSGPAMAQTSIVALVNNVPITSAEVSERRALVRLTQRKEITARQALDQLIDARLLFQEADKRRVTVSDADVDERYNAIAESTKLGPEKLTQALAQSGASKRAFQAEIRHGLLQRKVMSMLARTATGISEKDIAAGITAKKGEAGSTAYRYVMQQIIFTTQKGATPAQINQRKSEAEGLRRRVQSCAQGADIAKELRDVAVKPQITRTSAQLPAGFREQINVLKIGQSTKPEANDVGVEIIVICDKQETKDDTALRNEVQNALIMETGKSEVDKFVADLRKRAIIIYK